MKALNSLFIMIGIMVAAPFLMQFLFADPILQQVGCIAIMIVSILWLRTRIKGIAKDVVGSKMVWMCSACSLPHMKSECPRCGSRQRKLT